MSSPVCASHLHSFPTRRSSDLRLPSPENPTELTKSMCPSNGPATRDRNSTPLNPTHVKTESETTRLPSTENPTELTQSVCPSNGPATSSPDCTSQTQTFLSHEP